MTYYNENDPKAAAWLRELIKEGHIPSGEVDQRDLQDVKPHELSSFTQQHFFAGLGGWAYALRLAGWPDSRPVRTGSCPCQPFSAAGKQLAEKDPRHLWPVFRDLITFGEATITFGEQVASAAGRVWLAGIRADLEGMGYAVGAADLCSAGVGSPNIRQRLYWMAHADRRRRIELPQLQRQTPQTPPDRDPRRPHPDGCRRPSRLAYAGGPRRDGSENAGATCGAPAQSDCEGHQPAGRIESERESFARRLADTDGRQSGHGGLQPGGLDGLESPHGGACRLGDSAHLGHDRRPNAERERAESESERNFRGESERPSYSVRLGDPDVARSQGRDFGRHGAGQWTPWTASVVLPCTDGKARRIEPGSFPLAHGIPGRVGLLRGYGNAINPWLAAEFILASEEAVSVRL